MVMNDEAEEQDLEDLRKHNVGKRTLRIIEGVL
jgi:hypothetical protein